MSNHISVNLTIGEDEQPIANWFNYLKIQNKSISKWVSGLIAAEQLGQTPLYLKTVSPDLVEKIPVLRSGPVFGYGFSDNSNSIIKPDSKQIRGPHGEFIIGSSVVMSFSRTEIVKFLNQLKADHYSPAVYVKALIQKNLESPPSEPELTDKIVDNALRDYLLDSVAHYNLQRISEQADIPKEKE